jgi:hypothetical protein
VIVARKSHVFNVAVLGVGLVAFAIMLATIDWSAMAREIAHVGRWFVVNAAIDFASIGCDSFGIHGFLRVHAKDASYARVFAAEASGLAINRLTPGNTLGEPTKVTMLMQHVPQDAAISAIVLFNLTTMFVGTACLVIGVPITLLLVDLPPDITIVVWVVTAIVVAAAVALAIVVRRGAVGTLVDAIAAARLISPARRARWHDRIATIDHNLRGIRNARGIAGVVASRLLYWLGTIALLHAASFSVSPTLVIAVLSVGLIITWASNIIPLGIGLADGGNAALFLLLHQPPGAGVVFAMINRLRTVVLASMGLVVMLTANLIIRARARPDRPRG